MTLFEFGETVASPRLRLSRLDSDALADMSGWLEPALAPEWSLTDFEAAVQSCEAVLVCDHAVEPVGLALVRLDSPGERDATLSFLAIDPQRRFRGLGGEAALALERQVRARCGARRVYAPVPEARGLAVYFWLRLGYRPLSLAEAPDAPLGLTGESKPGIWMLRDKVQ